MMSRRILPLAFMLVPGLAAAFTDEQRGALDRYDEQFIEHGTACFGYEVALMRAGLELGLASSQTPESKLGAGVLQMNGYMFTDLPVGTIEELILAKADQLASAGQQVASLLKDGVPLGDPRYEPARQGSAPCGEMFDVAIERGRWANDNGLELPR